MNKNDAFIPVCFQFITSSTAMKFSFMTLDKVTYTGGRRTLVLLIIKFSNCKVQ